MKNGAYNSTHALDNDAPPCPHHSHRALHPLRWSVPGFIAPAAKALRLWPTRRTAASRDLGTSVTTCRHLPVGFVMVVDYTVGYYIYSYIYILNVYLSIYSYQYHAPPHRHCCIFLVCPLFDTFLFSINVVGNRKSGGCESLNRRKYTLHGTCHDGISCMLSRIGRETIARQNSEVRNRNKNDSWGPAKRTSSDIYST